MNILRVLPDDQDLFRGLDPFSMLAYLSFPNCFALSVVELEQDEGIPVGLIVCELKDTCVEIKWLFVANGSRQRGVGTELLSTIFDIAAGAELPAVTAIFREEYGWDVVCPDAERYFAEHLFSQKQELPGEWVTDLYALSLNPNFQGVTSDKMLTPLGKMPVNALKNSIELFSQANHVVTLYPVEGELGRLEKKLSFFVKSQQDYHEGILMQAVGDTLYLVLLQAYSQKTTLELLQAVFFTAKGSYPLSTKLRIVLDSGNFAPLIAELFPASKVQTYSLRADVAAYIDERADTREMPYDEMIKTLNAEAAETSAARAAVSRPVTEQDFVCTVQDLKAIDYLQEDEINSQIASIGSLDLQQFYRCLKIQLSIRVCDWYELDLKKRPITWYEPDVSCCIKKGEDVQGLFLVHRDPSGQLWTEYLSAVLETTDPLLPEMLRYSTKKLIELYPPDTQIVIRRHDANIAAIVSRLFLNAAHPSDVPSTS